MDEKSTTSLDMNDIIFNAIINGDKFPIKGLSDTEKEDFAKQIADQCCVEAFLKNRDNFQKNIIQIVSNFTSIGDV